MYSVDKKITPPKSIYSHYVLFAFLALSLLFPPDSKILPLFILIITLIVISIFIFPRFWIIGNVSGVGTSRGKRVRRWSRYKRSLVLIYVAGVLTLFFLFFTEVVGYYNIAMSFLVISASLMFVSIYFYISNSNWYFEKDKGVIIWGAQFISIFIAYCILSWAKNSTMNYMDLTYGDASSRTIIYAYFIILMIVLSFVFSGFIYMFITLFESKVIDRQFNTTVGKNVKLCIKYDSIPVSMPFMLLVFIIFLCYFKHHVAVDSYFIRQSIEFDSSEGFYCAGGYKTFGSDKEARFIKVSDNDYRAFIFDGYNISSYRLSCMDSYPYYKMSFILNKAESIRMKMKLDELNDDLNHIIKIKR
ncbi:hypothetical protein [Pectobacterium parmentieri]|uniref:Uncharacterized protein n=1 Tax=Pectobacterium parmentieri TaxID=1905730 RepID=A0A8B3FBW1_PECPM|nr:hypothetical protein [Pectobacterium parmentieri]AOR58044.1 hypothetical protein A8F97_03870 [Pectobacterium parmentieri]AYH10939.1 hypothetical protein C5E24_15220 [Pectobacterium parmentieri]AYH18347.1 hypothetical protein C5E22_07565 [Pectobacterium parmentieri]AYH37222.1 hypothetical protein C5E17_14965 [Pectobacterium parmentieri]AZS57452.1 hypothetical protein C5E18_15660 [Pectobacterium parmentieri]